MIRFELAPRCGLRDFVRIARAKDEPRRKRLLDSARTIGNAVKAFDSCAPDLAKLVPCMLPLDVGSDLRHAYGSQTDPLKVLIAKIKLMGSKHRCQYCGINPEADTLDHYLEKAIYPEFAVFYRNLVPSCGTCNRDRDQTIQDGYRSVLSFFDDPIDQVPELLVTQLFPSGSGFRATFALRIPPPGSPTVAEVYCRHFVSLDLAARYERASTDELAELLRTVVDTQLTNRRAKFSRNFATKQLARDAASLRSRAGNNDWRVALREASANSVIFVDACQREWEAECVR